MRFACRPKFRGLEIKGLDAVWVWARRFRCCCETATKEPKADMMHQGEPIARVSIHSFERSL